MEYVHLFFQTFLDALAMYLLCSFVAAHPPKLNKNSVYWFSIFQLFCIIMRLEFVAGSDLFFDQVDFMNYDLLPVNSIGAMLFLLLSMFVLNSLFFKLTNNGVLFTTILAFVLWILIRMFSIVAVNVFAVAVDFDLSYLYRVLTVVLAYFLYRKLSIALLNPYTVRKNVYTKIVLVNSLVSLLLLVAYTNFDTAIILQNLLYIVIVFSFVILINAWIVYEQKRRSNGKNVLRPLSIICLSSMSWFRKYVPDSMSSTINCLRSRAS